MNRSSCIAHPIVSCSSPVLALPLRHLERDSRSTADGDHRRLIDHCARRPHRLRVAHEDERPGGTAYNGQDRIIPPAHCQLIDYGCDIYFEMISDPSLTCRIDNDELFYEPPSNDGSGTWVALCEIKEDETSRSVRGEDVVRPGARALEEVRRHQEPCVST